MENIIKIEQIQELGKQLKLQAKTVVLVGGCFDLLHLGHITLLEEAKKQGDVLVVLLESDARIKKLKGSERPLHTQMQRARMLTAIKSVDYVILLSDTMDDADYENVTKQLQPAIIATTRGSDSLSFIEKQAKDNGASVFLVDPIENLSTSKILEAVAKEL